MKKITLFAVAALASTSAFAARPIVKAADKPQAQRVAVEAVKSTNSVTPSFKGAISRADETVVPAAQPTYVAYQTFYVGLSREWMGYDKNFGIAPALGKLPFLNLSGAQSSAWSAAHLDFMTGDMEEVTATTDNFIQEMTPATALQDVTLVADNTTYCDSTVVYYAGDPEFWDFIDTDKEDYTPDQVFGVIPTAFRGGRGSVGSLCIDKAPAAAIAKYYQPNGTYASWATAVEDFAGCTDVALTGYGFYLPATGSSYLLSAMYLPVAYNISEDLTINMNVYACDENGIPTDKLLGKGTAILPQGNTAVMDPVSGAYMMSVNLRAVNALNIATNSPIVVDQPVYVAMTGFDSDAVTSFNIMVCTGTNVPMVDYTKETARYWHTLYPSYADVIMSATDIEGKPFTQSVDIPWVFNFNSDEALKDKYVIPSNYFAFYNITYPYVTNAIIGEEGFVFDAPIEGGEDVFILDSNLDIAQLYDDMLIDAEASADWVDFEVGVVEDSGYEFTAVQVTAKPLPAGVEGRTATIDFKGSAADFSIIVNQGAAGINEVVAAKAKNGKVYDLQGRVVTKATKGIYIVDGKKVVL